MKTEFDEYTRIGKGFLGMSSLWLGNDHLLYIKGSGLFLPFREEYRRFRYQDIHAVSTVKTGGMWGYGVLLLLGLTIFSLITYAILLERDPDSNLGLVWMLAGPLPLALLCFIFLVRNFVLGPRCICELQTALKRERIGPLSRKIKANQVIAVLEERIREHQTAAQAEIPESAGEFGPIDFTPQPQVVPKFAPIGLVISAITGLLLIAMLHFGTVPMVVGIFVGLLASIVLTLGSLIVSVRNPCPDSFRALLWILFGAIFSTTGTALVYYAVVAFDSPEVTVGSGPLAAFTSISPQGSLVFYLIFLVLGIAMAGTSLIALAISSRFKKGSSPNIRTEEAEADSN